MIAAHERIPPADREHIVAQAGEFMGDLAGARLFITGATGFFGKWLLEAITAANDQCATRIRAVLLTRDRGKFAAQVPHLAHRPEFDWVIGSPAAFEFPASKFDYLVDFASQSAAEIAAGGEKAVEDSLQGTENLARFAKSAGVRRWLYASSGATYGRLPEGMERFAEDHAVDGATLTPYGRLKKRTEAAILDAAPECVIARGFAFIGPYLPLTGKFAAGSFLRDALSGGPIHVLGDGSPIRSYLHGADMAVWLLAMLARGQPGRAYNLGSDRPVTLLKLAECIAGALPAACSVVIAGAVGENRDCYVPDISRARAELGVEIAIGFESAVRRSVESWLGGHSMRPWPRAAA